MQEEVLHMCISQYIKMHQCIQILDILNDRVDTTQQWLNKLIN